MIWCLRLMWRPQPSLNQVKTFLEVEDGVSWSTEVYAVQYISFLSLPFFNFSYVRFEKLELADILLVMPQCKSPVPNTFFFFCIQPLISMEMIVTVTQVHPWHSLYSWSVTQLTTLSSYSSRVSLTQCWRYWFSSCRRRLERELELESTLFLPCGWIISGWACFRSSYGLLSSVSQRRTNGPAIWRGVTKRQFGGKTTPTNHQWGSAWSLVDLDQ